MTPSRAFALCTGMCIACGIAIARDRPPTLVLTPSVPAPLPRTVPVVPRQDPAPPRLPPAPVGPGVVALSIEERVERYRVPGKDLAALRAALASEVVSDAAGGSHGRTRSDISIAYSPRPVQGGCVAQAPALEITITTTLPEWAPAPGVADPALLARWQSMAAALQRHEARHREHALAAVRDLQATLAGLGVQPDCHALRRAVDQAFLRVRLKAEFRDARFDERTGNGRLDGVVL